MSNNSSNKQGASGRRIMSDGDFVWYLKDNHGLYVVEVAGDGNCLFYALSRGILNNTEQQMDVREVVAEYIRSHPVEFGGFADQYLTFEGMIQETLRSHNFSYEFQLIAASEAFGVNILVYFPDGSITSYPHDRRHQQTVNLSFHNGIHYNLLVPFEDYVCLQQPSKVIVLEDGERFVWVRQPAGHPIYHTDSPAEPDHAALDLSKSFFSKEGIKNESVIMKELAAVLEEEDDDEEDETDEILIEIYSRMIDFLAVVIVQELMIVWMQMRPFPVFAQALALCLWFCKCVAWFIGCHLLMYYFE